MWRRAPLRLILNLVFATLLALWGLVDVARLLGEARPLAQEEARSVMRVTRAYFESSLSSLQAAPFPEVALMSLVGGVDSLSLRHVRVSLSSSAAAPIAPSPAPPQAPAWFRALIDIPVEATSLPAVIGGRRLGWIVIATDPADAIDEVWRRVRAQIGADVALGVLLLLASSMLVTRALRPLPSAVDALTRLEAGDFQARADIQGSREFVEIATRINALGAALAALSAANEKLLASALDAHDEERKLIAHELHDEIGPHLFALRAQAATLRRRIEAGELQEGAAAALEIGRSVEALQSHNRRILSTLRPAALDDLGLRAALEALIEQLRRAEPSVEPSLSAAPEIDQLGERASLAVYRFVQEALTNAYRHSGASHVDAVVSYDSPRPPPRGDDPALAGLRIRVLDDGHGLKPEAGAGLGLAGMRDRVKALGGAFRFDASPETGAVVEAWFGGEGDFPESDGSARAQAPD